MYQDIDLIMEEDSQSSQWQSCPNIQPYNYEQVNNGNPQLFKNLEKQITEFLNNTKWTENEVKDVEKIECNFFINVTSYGSNNFEATLQVQASRPVFNSTLSSPILNVNDKNFNFRFIEFENMIDKGRKTNVQ